MDAEIQVLVQNEIQRLLSSDPAQAIMIAARAIEQANNEKNELQHHINTELMPKVEMWKMAMDSGKLFEMSEVAKILNFKNIGSKKLFEYLRERNVLRSNEFYKNQPYQRYVDSGYFKPIEQIIKRDEWEFKNVKTLVTNKGIDWIAKLLLEDGYELNAR